MFAYLHIGDKGTNWLARAVECVELAIHRLPEFGKISLHGGLAGFGWAFSHIRDIYKTCVGPATRDISLWEDSLTQIDARIISTLEQESCNISANLLHGLVGLGVYFMERLPRPDAYLALELILGRFEAVSKTTGSGTTNPTPPLGQRLQTGNTTCIASGTGGIVYLLDAFINAKFEVERSERLLEATVNGILKSQNDSSLRWCSGGLGVGAVLHQTATRLNRTDWSRCSGLLLDHCAKHSFEATKIIDTSLCHGAFGVAHIFNRVYQQSLQLQHRENATLWYTRGLQLRRPQLQLGGFPSWNTLYGGAWTPDSSLRWGAVGATLALLSAMYPIEPQWDRLMLLSHLPMSRATSNVWIKESGVSAVCGGRGGETRA